MPSHCVNHPIVFTKLAVIIKVKLLYSIWISVECIYERLSYFDVLVIKFILESLK